ncbi:LOW QUALITY PROTEIN: hypothetical protein PHMEG_0006077 [Phytophthora megakarya]|uniref:Uncharacterized protein n=1 Tax=Phytophthora megakarya TaxID=4795 RepID=A0A225WRH6_9STRA|nr:LOW QUALITY PROTEIN: hypothetical protein PHMEG_0006077 [Phytophthora megakarya]
MSTPLKALIQERLRAKMVGRQSDYDEDYDRQPMDVTAYDISNRRDGDERSTSSQGSSTRRSSLPQSNYPMRLHTHIDPAAYLVPSEHNDRYYPPSTPYGPNNDIPTMLGIIIVKHLRTIHLLVPNTCTTKKTNVDVTTPTIVIVTNCHRVMNLQLEGDTQANIPVKISRHGITLRIVRHQASPDLWREAPFILHPTLLHEYTTQDISIKTVIVVTARAHRLLDSLHPVTSLTTMITIVNVIPGSLMTTIITTKLPSKSEIPQHGNMTTSTHQLRNLFVILLHTAATPTRQSIPRQRHHYRANFKRKKSKYQALPLFYTCLDDILPLD